MSSQCTPLIHVTQPTKIKAVLKTILIKNPGGRALQAIPTHFVVIAPVFATASLPWYRRLHESISPKKLSSLSQ